MKKHFQSKTVVMPSSFYWIVPQTEAGKNKISHKENSGARLCSQTCLNLLVKLPICNTPLFRAKPTVPTTTTKSYCLYFTSSHLHIHPFCFLYPKSQGLYFLKCAFLLLKFWYYVNINFEHHHIIPELVT